MFIRAGQLEEHISILHLLITLRSGSKSLDKASTRQGFRDGKQPQK